MKSVLRVALVGCGEISGNHIGSILETEAELVAICDVLPEKAREKAAKYGLKNTSVYENYEEMLDRERPDVVHICTPHDLHAPMAIAALERGINVLCEKPLCISMEQLTVLREAEERSVAQIGVCHQNRYKPSMQTLRELARDGVSGVFGSVVWKRDDAYYRSGDWRGTWAREGGGVMINQALHTLDLLQWIAGMPTHVTAQIGNWTHRGVIEVEDTASATFVCENGMPMQFFATTSAGASLPITVQMMLADKRKVMAQNDVLMVNAEPVRIPSRSGALAGKEVWGVEHAALIADFYRCVRSGEHFPIDVEEAGRVVRLILSMYRSNGETIEILQ